jgi:hypothetical protein
MNPLRKGIMETTLWWSKGSLPSVFVSHHSKPTHLSSWCIAKPPTGEVLQWNKKTVGRDHFHLQITAPGIIFDLFLLTFLSICHKFEPSRHWTGLSFLPNIALISLHHLPQTGTFYRVALLFGDPLTDLAQGVPKAQPCPWHCESKLWSHQCIPGVLLHEPSHGHWWRASVATCISQRWWRLVHCFLHALMWTTDSPVLVYLQFLLDRGNCFKTIREVLNALVSCACYVTIQSEPNQLWTKALVKSYALVFWLNN